MKKISQVYLEAYKHRDLIFLDNYDSHRNLTIKTRETFRWARFHFTFLLEMSYTSDAITSGYKKIQYFNINFVNTMEKMYKFNIKVTWHLYKLQLPRASHPSRRLPRCVPVAEFWRLSDAHKSAKINPTHKRRIWHQFSDRFGLGTGKVKWWHF